MVNIGDQVTGGALQMSGNACSVWGNHTASAMGMGPLSSELTAGFNHSGTKCPAPEEQFAKLDQPASAPIIKI